MMLQTLFVNPTSRDIEINSLKNLRTINDTDSIAQRIWIRLNTNRGEDMFDTNIGVPWHSLFDNKATPEQFKVEIRDEIQKEEYVQQVVYVNVDEFDRSTRELKISFKAVLTTGKTLESQGVVVI